MIRISKDGEEIRSVDDWFRLAPPKGGEIQWVDRRSAKELAKAWLPITGRAQIPSELSLLLNSRAETRGLVIGSAEPERIARLDNCRGTHRNADLVLWGEASCGNVVISIEAKADEPFGKIAHEHRQASIAGEWESGIPKRLSLICQGLFGTEAPEEEALSLRYQLLTACVGTLVEKTKCAAAIGIMIIHEFIGKTQDENVQANANDLNQFVRALSGGQIESVAPETLVGPFTVPGNAFFNGTGKLFIGKCRRDV